MAEHRRADARRNYARILAVAEEEVAEHGAAASMEQIARTAGVGSGTVRRHFPSRRALLEAVSQKRIEALSDRARDLAGADDARGVLLKWMDDVVGYCVTARGLAAALAYGESEPDPVHNSCAAALEEAGAPLLRRAVQEGTVRPDVTVSDLLTLAVGIALATETHPDPAGQAARTFRLTVEGLNPQEGAGR